MLKIENVSRHYDVALEVKQSKIFNSLFLKAFLFACLLHLTAALIFHIGPFLIVSKGNLLPAFVDIEFAANEKNVLAQIEPDKKKMRFSSPPKITQPNLPPLSTPMMMHDLEALQEFKLLNHPFLKLENELQAENFFAKQNQKPKVPLTLQMSVTGPLSKIEPESLQALTKNESLLSLLKPLGSLHAVYSVRVENKTGRIFFLESISDKEPHELSKFLKELTFKPQDTGFVTTGEITLDFKDN